MGTGDTRVVLYYCSYCKSQKEMTLFIPLHERKVEESPNGLVLYTDTHRGKLDSLEIVNLHIDSQCNVRTHELLKIPEYKVMKAYQIPLPGMKKSGDELVELVITQLPKIPVRMVIENIGLQLTITIGEIEKGEEELYEVTSTYEGVRILIYDRIDPRYILDWLKEFINTLEILPPIKLGDLVEVLQYIFERSDSPIQNFDKQLIRTILASHEVYIKLSENADLQKLKEKMKNILTEEDIDLVNLYFKVLEEDQNIPVNEMISKSPQDLIHQLYLMLIMEKEHLVSIDRPGIVNG